MKKINIATLLTYFSLLIGIALLILFISHSRQRKLVYVVTLNLYNEFDYKKEIEKKYIDEIKARKSILDSVQVEIQYLYEEIRSYENKKPDNKILQDFKRREAALKQKKQEILASNEELTRKYDEQIWKQLNQYIQDYTESSSYDFILGAKGDATILGAKKRLDITPELVKYVNERYHGIK